MREKVICLCVCLLLALAAPAQCQDEKKQEEWAFKPTADSFSPLAVFDLRTLNETEAGSSGFVSVDNHGHFVLGNGKSVRFWGVCSYVGRDKPFVHTPLGIQNEPDLDRHARFLAKRGVNLVKILINIAPDPQKHPELPLEGINNEARDWIWRTVAAYKKQGIYSTITFFWPADQAVNPTWNVDKDDLQSLVFFEPRVQAAYKSWLKQLFGVRNPYTGIPLSQDPSVAFITLVHEDSLLFWTLDAVKGKNRLTLDQQFTSWATAKYGSVSAVRKAWNSEANSTDSEEVFDLYAMWKLTKSATGESSQRQADQMEFLIGTMRTFYTGIESYLRQEVQFKPLINAGNWQPVDPAINFDAERYAASSNEIDGLDRYFGSIHQGPNAGWAISSGDKFVNDTVLNKPTALPINVKRIKGRPFIMNESSWTAPNLYESEGPAMIAAYGSLTGFDAFIWFCLNDEGFNQPRSANGYVPSLSKWDVGTPCTLGQFPAAALLYRRGDVEQTPPILIEARSLEDLWHRKSPSLQESVAWDANPASKTSGDKWLSSGSLSSFIFLQGQTEWSPADKSAVIRKDQSLDQVADSVTSANKELELNWKLGTFTVDSPKAQGGTALFTQAGKLSLHDLSIQSTSSYATVLAVSLDNLDLKDSKKILVQIGTTNRPEGWKQSVSTIENNGQSVSGFSVDDVGHAPWKVNAFQGFITLNNSVVKHAYNLDANGVPTAEIGIARKGNSVSLTLPRDTLYVALTSDKLLQ